MSQTYTLTVLDTTRIQEYIFGSNRLQENIGASELVEQATVAWPLQLLAEIDGRELSAERRLAEPLRIEDGQLAAEVVYAGGGNTVIVFRNPGDARRFAELYTRRLIQRAPGLEAVLVHQDVTWDDAANSNTLKTALAEAFKKLGQRKATRPVSGALLGLGVTAACESTGRPATAYDPFYLRLGEGERRFRPVASEILAKAEYVEAANRRLASYVKPISDSGFAIPYDFDHFGRARGEISYIAVVHADGNNMSRRFSLAASQAPDNRSAVIALRHLSQQVNSAGQRALTRLTEKLIVAWDSQKRKLAGTIPVDHTMPFRPLVYGGDDVTFVCDGRLGLALATTYLRLFEEEAQNVPYRDQLGPVFACAGIAVVKTHYPFARAYALAEDLCQQAKRYVREQSIQTHEPGFSALDWHFAAGGLYGKIEHIRQREYTVPAGNLSMRPLRLTARDNEWRTWPAFEGVVQTFKTGQTWTGKRNKVIQLRDALRAGPVAVRQYRTAYTLDRLPPLSSQEAALETDGWSGGGICGYFDAIEALDFHQPIV